MGNTKDRKLQKAKARHEALRRQKASAAAKPRVLRANPDLAAALSTRHPLIGYFINKDWTKTRMAAVHVVRQTESGQAFAGFLVDTAWLGTKDAYGNYGQPNAVEDLRQRNQKIGFTRIDADTAVNLVRGGVAWARRFGYPLPEDLDLWLRLVDPLPPGGPDLRMFGEDGKRPIVIGSMEQVLRYEGRGRGLGRPRAAGDEDEDEEDGEDYLEILSVDPPPAGAALPPPFEELAGETPPLRPRWWPLRLWRRG